MIEHLRPRQIWDFVDADTELNGEERQHLIKCEACWAVFQILFTKLKSAPAKSDEDADGNAQKQSA